MTFRRPLALVVVAAACAQYVPGSFEPNAAPAAYASRTLRWSAVRDSVAPYADTSGIARGDPAALAIAALFLRADVAAGHAEVAAKRAAVAMADRGPGVGVEGQLEQLVYGQSQGAPWVVGLAPVLRMELGGKRAARTLVAAAELSLAEMHARSLATTAAAEVRRAVWLARSAEARLLLAERLVGQLERFDSATATRAAAGEIGPAETLRARQLLADARLQATAQRQAMAEARIALSRALQVPHDPAGAVLAFGALPSGAGLVGACVMPDAREAWRARALTGRYDVGSALAAYARADALVRVQVAAAAPDLQLAPGFVWDQSTNRWTLGIALPEFRLDRNRAGIRSAVATREAEAARAAAVQTSVLAEIDAALARCAASGQAIDDARAVGTQADSVAAQLRRRWQRGEVGARDTLNAAIGVTRARAAELDARLLVLQARLDLDLAANAWTLDQPPARWPSLGLAAPERAARAAETEP
jgi:CRISPR system Cascade subunit CasA